MLVDNLQSNYLLVLDKYPDNTKRKNYFLAACKTYIHHDPESNEMTTDEIWDTIDQMNISSPYGGLIGRGDSKADKIFGFLKHVRLHAVLHDAAGQLRTFHDIGPGYPYACCCSCCCSCCPKSPYVGHVSGLLYCTWVKWWCKSYQELEL